MRAQIKPVESMVTTTKVGLSIDDTDECSRIISILGRRLNNNWVECECVDEVSPDEEEQPANQALSCANTLSNAGYTL